MRDNRNGQCHNKLREYSHASPPGRPAWRRHVVHQVLMLFFVFVPLSPPLFNNLLEPFFDTRCGCPHILVPYIHAYDRPECFLELFLELKSAVGVLRKRWYVFVFGPEICKDLLEGFSFCRIYVESGQILHLVLDCCADLNQTICSALPFFLLLLCDELLFPCLPLFEQLS